MHSNEERHMRAHGAAPRRARNAGREEQVPADLGWDWGPPRGGRIGLSRRAVEAQGTHPMLPVWGRTRASATGTPTTTQPIGNPTLLLDEWAACIRSHGDPNQVDPTIDANKDIEITMRNVSPTLSSAVHGSTGPCSNYLLSAEAALRGGQAAPHGTEHCSGDRVCRLHADQWSPQLSRSLSGRRHQVRRHWYQHEQHGLRECR